MKLYTKSVYIRKKLKYKKDLYKKKIYIEGNG